MVVVVLSLLVINRSLEYIIDTSILNDLNPDEYELRLERELDIVKQIHSKLLDNEEINDCESYIHDCENNINHNDEEVDEEDIPF